MALGLGTAYLIGEGVSAGSKLLGGLLGSGARKKAQRLFDMSIDDLRALEGRQIFDPNAVASAGRRSLIPQIHKDAIRTSKRYNIDQPKVGQYLLDQAYDRESGLLPGLLEREATARSNRDFNIRSAIPRLRALQLG